MFCIKNTTFSDTIYVIIIYSTAERHCPLTRRPEPTRALIVNI